MKLLKHMKDGGAESRVDGYWFIEAKRLLSIALLHFSDGSRDAFHNHAFNSISWLLKGELNEESIVSFKGETRVSKFTTFKPSFWPIIIRRSNLHQVKSSGDSWVFTLRGPWANTWSEFIPATKRFLTLTHRRKVVG